MAQEGKFSNPRPHRDEERQIEETFRQLTEEKKAPRRNRQPQADTPLFSQTLQEIEEAPLFSQTLQEIAGQEPPAVQPQTPEAPPQAAAAPVPPRTPRTEDTDETILLPKIPDQQPAARAAARPQTPPVRKEPDFDLIPQDVESFFDGDGSSFEEEPAEPDRMDALLAWLSQAADFCKENRKLVAAAACAAALVVILAFVAVFSLSSGRRKDDGTILNNVMIADISVGGMTKNEAISAVTQAAGSTYTSQDMVVDLSGTQLRLSPKDTKAELDVKAAVDAAYDYGRTGTQAERDQALEESRTQKHIIGLLPYLELDTDYILNTLTDHAKDTGSTLTQTAYGLEGEEPELSTDKFDEDAPIQTLVITMGTPGIGFDAKDVYNKVLDAYSLHVFLVSVENVESTQEPDPIDLEAIYKEFYIEPVNATIDLQNFEPVPGSYGYEFDLKEAQKLLDKAEYGEELRIPMQYIEPEVLKADAFLSDTLGEYQTRQTSNSDRNRNLDLACEAIDGFTMDPGETLSFSDLLGKRSKDRGYKSAPEDSGVEETMGGGINQVASTLYYAALMADLDIVSRSNNDFVPSYIDMGLDATADLKIRNSTGFPVSIEAKLSGGFVSIRILGTEERDYYVMLEYAISSTQKPQTEYEDFEYDNDEGYEDGDIIEEGITGYQVKSYKVKYDTQTGRELSRDYVTNSSYPASDRIVARVEEPETEPPTEEPTEPPTEAPTKPSKPTEPTPPPTEATVPPTQATEPPETVPPVQTPSETEPDAEPTEDQFTVMVPAQQEEAPASDEEVLAPEELPAVE